MMGKEMDLPCNCWEGYVCNYCKVRNKVKDEMVRKYERFHPKSEQNAEQFISDAINFTIRLMPKLDDVVKQEGVKDGNN